MDFNHWSPGVSADTSWWHFIVNGFLIRVRRKKTFEPGRTCGNGFVLEGMTGATGRSVFFAIAKVQAMRRWQIG